MKIEISNLSFKYDKKHGKTILNSINLGIQEGSINVLLGLNGCGKSTLIKNLAGLEKPTEGIIKYDDRDLETIRIKERATIFAYVPQHAYITTDIPVRQYLSYGTTNTLMFYENPGKEEMVLVEKTAYKLGISNLLDKNLSELSGGELQKVLIACALIQNANVLLLDEPTSALDMKNQNKVLNLLNEISKEGKTILLSTHNPNHALYLNSNVILMNEGKVVKTGQANDLIKVNTLKEIYGDQICVSKDLAYEEISFK